MPTTKVVCEDCGVETLKSSPRYCPKCFAQRQAAREAIAVADAQIAAEKAARAAEGQDADDDEEDEFNCPSCNKGVAEEELDRHEGECCDECDSELRVTCSDCLERFWTDDMVGARCGDCNDTYQTEIQDELDEEIQAIKDEGMAEKALEVLKAAGLI